MDKIDYTSLGGVPLVLDDFRWYLGQASPINDAIYQAFNDQFREFGDNYIVQGCVVTGSVGSEDMTEGWIVLAGELLKVDAITTSDLDTSTDSTFTKVTTTDSSGDKTTRSDVAIQTYQKNRGVLSGSGGTLAFDTVPLHLLKRILFEDDSAVLSNKSHTTKVIEIGDWDMDADASVNVTHGLDDEQKIRNIRCMIRDDAITQVIPLNSYSGTVINGGIGGSTSTIVVLRRAASANFDNTSFDQTSFNRGWVTIEYEL